MGVDKAVVVEADEAVAQGVAAASRERAEEGFREVVIRVGGQSGEDRLQNRVGVAAISPFRGLGKGRIGNIVPLVARCMGDEHARVRAAAASCIAEMACTYPHHLFFLLHPRLCKSSVSSCSFFPFVNVS